MVGKEGEQAGSQAVRVGHPNPASLVSWHCCDALQICSRACCRQPFVGKAGRLVARLSCRWFHVHDLSVGVCIGLAVYIRHVYVYMLLHIGQQLSGALGDSHAVRPWQ